jgi:hypothetical protein
MYRNYKAAAANLARLLVYPRGNPGGGTMSGFSEGCSSSSLKGRHTHTHTTGGNSPSFFAFSFPFLFLF